jgi:hypothetical protein
VNPEAAAVFRPGDGGKAGNKGLNEKASRADKQLKAFA